MGISRTSYQPAVVKLDFVGGRMWLGDEIRPKMVNGSVCTSEKCFLRVMKYDE
jgi:hypothetical protein